MKYKLILVALFGAAVFLSVGPYLNDDSLISYRYAWHLVRGFGLVSYEGGPPVEGYSNPAFVFITAAVSYIVGMDELKPMIQIGMLLNTLSAIGILFLMVRWNREEFGAGWYSVMPAILLASSLPFVYARNTGLETILHTFILTVMVYFFTRNNVTGGAFFAAILSMSRPEGIGLAIPCILITLWKSDGNRSELFRRLRLMTICFLLPVICFYSWRYFYFGSLVSNTTLVKARFSERGVWDGEGLSYLYLAMKSTPLYLFLFPYTIGRMVHRKLWTIHSYEFITILSQIGFIAASGGDDFHFGLYRFIVPICPFVFRSTVIWWQYLNRWMSPAFCILILVLLSLPVYHSDTRQLEIPWLSKLIELSENPGIVLKRQWTRLRDPQPWIDEYAGEFIASLVPENGKGLSLASCQAGSLPIHWKGAFHDLVGLLSREYAVAPPDQRDQVFLDNPPDIVAAFRWQRGWFPIPSVAACKTSGYQPMALIRLIEKKSDFGISGDFVINYLMLVKDPSILTNMHTVQWDYTAPVAYQDPTGILESVVPVKDIIIADPDKSHAEPSS